MKRLALAFIAAFLLIVDCSGETGDLPSTIRALTERALAYVYRPGQDPSDLDSAMRLLMQAQALNLDLADKGLEARVYFVYSNAWREKGNAASGRRYCELSLEKYATLNSQSGTPVTRREAGEAYMEMAQYYPIDNDEGLTRRISCYQSAADLFRSSGDREKEGFALKNLGDLEQVGHHYGQALVDLQQAMTAYMIINYPSMQGVYDLLGAVYTALGDYDNGIKYGLKAVLASENDRDTSSLQLCTIYNRLAISYYKSKKYEQSIFYLKKALVIVTRFHNKADAFSILINLNVLLLSLNRWNESLVLIGRTEKVFPPGSLSDSVLLYTLYCYANTSAKRYDKAAWYADELRSFIGRTDKYDRIFSRTYTSLTFYYLSVRDFITAQYYCNENLRLVEKTQATENLPAHYRLQARLDSANGDFRSAFAHYKIYQEETDSIFSERKATQLNQIEVEFETEKKTRDLKIQRQNIDLLTQQSQLQEMSLKKGRLVRNSIILAAIVLLSILITGYKFKQRSNKRLRLKQTEINRQNALLTEMLTQKERLVLEKEGLVKEIHHRVKNNLQIIISLLNAQSEYVDHPRALEVIRTSRERMQAIALIHQKLYRQGDTSLINMDYYIRELISNLTSCFDHSSGIYFDLDIIPVDLDISQTVPLGLILNEAVTNAIKYAFVGRAACKKTVTITLKAACEGNLQLRIADNGRGFPVDMDAVKVNSLGMQLIELFAEQLGAQLNCCNRDGVEISLVFGVHAAAIVQI